MTDVNDGPQFEFEFELEPAQAPEIVVPEPPIPQSNEPTQVIEAKIVALLQVYPTLSPSMIQAGLGPSLPATLWRPVLQRLLQEGVLKQWEAPAPETVTITAGQERTQVQVRVQVPSGRTRPYLCVALQQAA